jgi:large subunit ribosomal protein L13
MSQAVGRTALAYARLWHQIDLSGEVLGRISPRIAQILMGKHKPIFDPSGMEFLLGSHQMQHSNYNPLSVKITADCGDYVVLVNAQHVKVTGNKDAQKLYRHHSGHPGGLKEIPYTRMLEQRPEDVIHFNLWILLASAGL